MTTADVKVIDFAHIKHAVARQFEHMQKYQMFRAKVDGQELWELYLKSFPAGTNPIFRERTEHDCSCCRHFIRDVGNVVALGVGVEVLTLWDEPTGDPAYDKVSKALAKLVRSRAIEEPFMHYERTAGTDKSFEGRGTDAVKVWNHFHVNVASGFVAKRADIPTLLSEKRATHDVLKRGLEEITMESVDQFLELVAQGSLYRGEEHAGAVQRFRALKKAYDTCASAKRDAFVWVTATKESPALSRIRNTVAGTLLVDLSEGKDLEEAVKSYESKVAPTNYKRPTALVTKKMVEQARETIAGFGLTSALERRFAVISDVGINNVLFADRRARKAIAGDVFDEVSDFVTDRAPKKLDAVEEVPIDRFLSEVLPRIDSLEVLLENRHTSNLVSLIAPVDPTAGLLFKWPNKFSWSYAGELADSIKERVKQAGGSVVGDLCCRLAWHNHDDLDLHMFEPGHGGWNNHIHFANKGPSLNGGRLDVDMNAGRGTTRQPVENIFYASKQTMREGVYELKVHQYSGRDSTDKGFEVEIDWMGSVYSFASEQSPRTSTYITVAQMEYTKRDGLKMLTALKESRVSRQTWGLATEGFHRASVVMLSPNHWDGAEVGNKHYFFMLDGCANDGTARGFFNEFLMPALDKHRKVFEMVGSKLKLAPASEQLSGLGFSSTQRNTLVCRVKGSFTRTIKVVF